MEGGRGTCEIWGLMRLRRSNMERDASVAAWVFNCTESYSKGRRNAAKSKKSSATRGTGGPKCSAEQG